MDLFISLYDILLIHYPNIFFVAVFLLFSLILITAFQLTKSVSVAEHARKILRKNYKLEPIKTTIRNFPIILITKTLRGIMIWISYVEFKIEKAVRRIGKEILIEQ